MFGLTITEFVLCLAGAAILFYILPYLIALLFLIVGLVCTVIGCIVEAIGYVINKIFGGRK